MKVQGPGSALVERTLACTWDVEERENEMRMVKRTEGLGI